MNTIQKYASELAPGDILAGISFGTDRARGVVTDNRADGRAGFIVTVSSLSENPGTRRIGASASMHFDVEAPELTRAQQHAGELVDELRRLRSYYKTLAGSMGGEVLRSTDDLLAKIDPPAPVTLEEAFAVLKPAGADTMTTDQYASFIGGAREVLKRARKAGQL